MVTANSAVRSHPSNERHHFANAIQTNAETNISTTTNPAANHHAATRGVTFKRPRTEMSLAQIRAAARVASPQAKAEAASSQTNRVAAASGRIKVRAGVDLQIKIRTRTRTKTRTVVDLGQTSPVQTAGDSIRIKVKVKAAEEGSTTTTRIVGDFTRIVGQEGVAVAKAEDIKDRIWSRNARRQD